jgi:hypothetical protein
VDDRGGNGEFNSRIPTIWGLGNNIIVRKFEGKNVQN